jgi:hypothetical protein
VLELPLKNMHHLLELHVGTTYKEYIRLTHQKKKGQYAHESDIRGINVTNTYKNCMLTVYVFETTYNKTKRGKKYRLILHVSMTEMPAMCQMALSLTLDKPCMCALIRSTQVPTSRRKNCQSLNLATPLAVSLLAFCTP